LLYSSKSNSVVRKFVEYKMEHLSNEMAALKIE